MKRFAILIVFAVACLSHSVAAGRISVSATDGLPGDTVSVQISVSGVTNAAAAEITVPVPDGFMYVTGSFSKGSRSQSMTVADSYADGRLRVLFYNTSLTDLPLDGNLFSFKVVLGEMPGQYNIAPTVVVSDSEGKQIDVSVSAKVVTVLGSIISLNTETVDFGRVAIRSDYTKSFEIRNSGTSAMTVSSIMGTDDALRFSETQVVIPAEGSRKIDVIFSPKASGAVNDTVVIESDAVNGQQMIVVSAYAYSVNELHVINSVDENGGIVSVGMEIDNMEPLTVMQCSFMIPDNLSFIDGSFGLTERGSGMKSFCSVDGNMLKLYVYSDSGKSIDEGHGMIGSFKMICSFDDKDYDLTPTDVILGNDKLDNVVSKTQGTKISIKGPEFEFAEEIRLGRVPVNTPVMYNWLVRNPGRKDLIIERVEFPDALVSAKGVFPITVSPGTEEKIPLEFNADTKGEYSSVMSVYSNCPEKELSNILISATVYEPNNLNLRGVMNAARKEFRVFVGLSNVSKIHALQFNLYGVDELELKECTIELTNRCSGFSTALTKNNDGSVQVLLYSLADKVIDGVEGDLLSLVFRNVNRIDGELMIKDIVMSDNVGNNISTLGSLTVVPDVDKTPVPIPGDANGDGVLNIADVSAVVGYIYGLAGDSFKKELADINKNGIINVTDISIIVTEIAGSVEK